MMPLRHPISVARPIATLDYLSGGRIIMAVGLGAEGFDPPVIPRSSCTNWRSMPKQLFRISRCDFAGILQNTDDV